MSIIWNEIKDSQMTFFWFIWHLSRRGYHSQVYNKAALPIWCLLYLVWKYKPRSSINRQLPWHSRWILSNIFLLNKLTTGHFYSIQTDIGSRHHKLNSVHYWVPDGGRWRRGGWTRAWFGIFKTLIKGWLYLSARTYGNDLQLL